MMLQHTWKIDHCDLHSGGFSCYETIQTKKGVDEVISGT